MNRRLTKSIKQATTIFLFKSRLFCSLQLNYRLLAIHYSLLTTDYPPLTTH
ncbi:hypothetical protein [Marinilabilia salmonicolor]|uniref:hypothetical protein n=1 Tax=Marinilabilia salmonicolor TaxID=989 RepID=UPI0015F06DE9|nr:hypothetical protein [Marinilabilia salmonicolor]